MPIKILWGHLRIQDLYNFTLRPASAAKEFDQNTQNAQYLGNHKDDFDGVWPVDSPGGTNHFNILLDRMRKDTTELDDVFSIEKSPYISVIWRTFILPIADT